MIKNLCGDLNSKVGEPLVLCERVYNSTLVTLMREEALEPDKIYLEVYDDGFLHSKNYVERKFKLETTAYN